MASTRGNIALLVVSTVLSIIAVEAILRVMAPIADPYKLHKRRPNVVQTYMRSSFPPNMRVQLSTEEGLPGMDGRPTTFTTNNVGLRGDSLRMPKPDDELRVFMVGGSTTETLYLDDRQAITRVLENRLDTIVPGKRVKVYGAGKSGARSYDHIEMIAHRLVHLAPDALIVFAGVNDLRAAMYGRDQLMLPPALGAPDTEWSLMQIVRFAVTEFQLGRRLFSLLKPEDYRDAVEQITLRSNFRRSVRMREALPVSASAPRIDVAPYRNNLISIAGIARSHGIDLVLLTQPTTWNSRVDSEIAKWHWMSAGPDSAYREAALDQAMEAYNDVVRAVAAQFDVPLFDIARLLPKSGQYFYDDVHFNPRGADTVASLLAPFVSQNTRVRRPR
ncbi:MAG TPA: GDSL-type esterase/lipase family protein [Gemmatimonadaceae bacterium]|nr:GDSL-type esterase/lipase family protein [Gemmatimonadaceae bacterium]